MAPVSIHMGIVARRCAGATAIWAGVTIMGLQIGFDFSAKNCGAGRAVGVLFVLSVYIRAHSEY